MYTLQISYISREQRVYIRFHYMLQIRIGFVTGNMPFLCLYLIVKAIVEAAIDPDRKRKRRRSKNMKNINNTRIAEIF